MTAPIPAWRHVPHNHRPTSVQKSRPVFMPVQRTLLLAGLVLLIVGGAAIAFSILAKG